MRSSREGPGESRTQPLAKNESPIGSSTCRFRRTHQRKLLSRYRGCLFQMARNHPDERGFYASSHQCKKPADLRYGHWHAVCADINHSFLQCSRNHASTLPTTRPTKQCSSRRLCGCGITHQRFKRALIKLKSKESTVDALQTFLMAYHSMPCPSGPDHLSPTEKFLGRRLRIVFECRRPTTS